jgi:transcriptional regulator with XRE-family HTH domain
MLKIGKKLIQLRETHNYSQELVSEKIGISQPNYSRIESDKLQPPADILPKLADLYGIDIRELFGTSSHGYNNSSNYKDNAFSAYVVYQESQKQYERIIAAQEKTILAQEDIIKALKEAMNSNQLCIKQ